MSQAEIHFAPLQGYTDKTYRMVFNQCFEGVSYFYTPYLSVDNSNEIKSFDDLVEIGDEMKSKTIPQVLPANLAELKVLAKVLSQLNFKRINLNTGCPYPMVTNKGRGSALIAKPELVRDMIRFLNDNYQFDISLKTRAGLENSHDIFTLLEKLTGEPISTIILHPRVAKQLYKGEADVAIYSECLTRFSNFDWIYNGDIVDYEGFSEKQLLLPQQQKWMMGRGLLKNPLLIKQIRNCLVDKIGNELLIKIDFAHRLVKSIIADSKNKEHALNKSKVQLIMLFGESDEIRKVAKKIKKAKSIDDVFSILYGI